MMMDTYSQPVEKKKEVASKKTRQWYSQGVIVPEREEMIGYRLFIYSEWSAAVDLLLKKKEKNLIKIHRYRLKIIGKWRG